MCTAAEVGGICVVDDDASIPLADEDCVTGVDVDVATTCLVCERGGCSCDGFLVSGCSVAGAVVVDGAVDGFAIGGIVDGTSGVTFAVKWPFVA